MNIKNKFLSVKKLKQIIAICSLLIANSVFAARDNSIDCAGRPRWDRFIVNESDTKWSASGSGCYSDGAGSDAKSLYGKNQTSLYGAFDSAYDPAAMYGKYSESSPRDWSRMYGKYDSSAPAAPVQVAPVSIIQPARVAAIPAKVSKPAAAPAAKPKQPVAAKPAAKPKPKLKPVPKAVPVAAPVIEVAEPAAAPEPVKVQPQEKAAPDAKAQNIARVLNDTIISEDSFCTRVSPAPVLGKLPRGLVLMPGRPDQMNCVRK
ncbi:MAG: hypothetical protein LBJ18_03050 [Rickettsiales bacterium]|jgi:hypothetical protein|nr:hypothetical protein [Rickettsiales bacterium]